MAEKLYKGHRLNTNPQPMDASWSIGLCAIVFAGISLPALALYIFIYKPRSNRRMMELEMIRLDNIFADHYL